MTPRDIVINQLSMSHYLYDMASKDMSDADACYVPFKGANHLNWILCHMAVSEDSLISQIGGSAKRLSEKLHTQYAGGSTCTPDDGMTKAEAMTMYVEQGKLTLEFLRSLPEAKYNDAAPEKLRQNFPTVGAVVGLIGAHPFWHFGQLTMNRKALNKPSLFGG